MRRNSANGPQATKPANGPIDDQKAEEIRKYCNSAPKWESKNCCGPSQRTDCAKLAQDIQKAVHRKFDPALPRKGSGIQERFDVQGRAIADWGKKDFKGLCPPDTVEWDNHNKMIEAEQSRVQHLMDAFKKAKCKEKLGKDTRRAAERPTPYRATGAGPRPGSGIPRVIRPSGFGAWSRSVE